VSSTRLISSRGAGRARIVALLLGATSGCAQLGLYRPGTADAPEVLDAVLTDTSIQLWPRQVARGKVNLEIVNQGLLEHGIRLVGPGVDEQSSELLGPGEHRRVSFKLGPGTYRLFCPDGNHAELGMWAQLVVGESPTWFRR
jgi:Sulfocyanin (SoxE) domain